MIYQFNEFQLDSANFSLQKIGKSIELEPQVFNLIIYLIENRERLVTRDEIFENLWDGKEVLDATLSNHIKIARSILGDDGKSQHIIKTIRGRGYQFIAEVNKLNTLDPAKPIQGKQRLSKWYGAAFIIVLIGLYFSSHFFEPKKAEKNSYIIAVLPFLNGKPDPSTDYLGLAIADQIIGDLTYIRNINVRASSTIRKYQSQQINPEGIGKQLNADLVLTGTYLAINDKIRFNIELIETATGKMFWRENNVEFDFTKPDDLQELIVNKLTSKLGLENIASEGIPTTKGELRNPLAYELYLKSISQPYSTAGNKKAIDLLKESILIDDNYAPAYSQLGNRIRRYEQFGLISSGESLKSFQYYQKALSIDNQLMSALSYLAFYYCETNRLDEAVTLANKIIKVNPDNADSHFTLGYVYRYAGLIEEAINEMEKAVNIDPTNIRYRSLVATYSGAREFSKAQKLVDTYDESSFTIGWDGLLNYRIGDYKSAEIHLKKLKEKDENGLWGLIAKIYLYLMSGEIEKGLVAIHELEQTNTMDSETVYYIAVYYGMFGDKRRSLNALNKAVNGGYYNYIFMQNSEFFDSFRDSPDFKQILELAQSKSLKFRQQQVAKNR